MKEPYSPLNKIWAPWRLQYVQNIPAKGCVFCKMRKENNDKNNYIFARSGHCFAVLNIFPYNNGHSLIVTNRHVDSLQRLNSEEILDLNKLLNIVTAVLEKILRPSGLNVGFNIGNASGAGIKKHLHMHIVPRW